MHYAEYGFVDSWVLATDLLVILRAMPGLGQFFIFLLVRFTCDNQSEYLFFPVSVAVFLLQNTNRIEGEALLPF
jgi:hypothetical protein